jgi:hypothetical protein
MSRTVPLLLLLVAVTASAAPADQAPPREPRVPGRMPVLAEGAAPELEISLTPATFGLIPLDRAEGDHPFAFQVYAYTPEHEGILGSHQLVLRAGETRRFDRNLPGNLRLRGTVTLAADGLVRYAAEILVKERVAARTSATLRPGWPAPPAAFRPAPSY